MSRRRQEGSISLELLVITPVLFALMWGGTLLAYGSYARAALQMAALRTARELAADSAKERMTDGTLYRYGDFTETYGLPRPKVQMIVGRTGSFIVAGTCYRLPLPLIRGRQRQSVIPPKVKNAVNQLTASEYNELISEVETVVTDGQAVAEDFNNLTKRVSNLFGSIKGLKLSKSPEFDTVIEGASRFVTPDDFDQAVRASCDGQTGRALIARSTFWSEPVDQRPKAPSAQPTAPSAVEGPSPKPAPEAPAVKPPHETTPEEKRKSKITVTVWPTFISNPNWDSLNVMVLTDPPVPRATCRLSRKWPSFSEYKHNEDHVFSTDVSGHFDARLPDFAPKRTRVDDAPVDVSVQVTCTGIEQPGSTTFKVQRTEPLTSR